MKGVSARLELLLQDAGRSPVGQRAIVELLDAAAQTKFEPARAGDTPVAVNVVWLLAQTRVRGRIAPPPSSPIERPRTISRSGESPDTYPARVSTPTTGLAQRRACCLGARRRHVVHRVERAQDDLAVPHVLIEHQLEFLGP